MHVRNLCLSSIAFAAILFAANPARAIGLRLGETKEQLKLDYQVSVVDLGTGRVTINLTIADQGRLKPLKSVDLVIPGKNGTGFADLSLSLATRTVDGKLVMSPVVLRREWAERAEIWLTTLSLDGKNEPLTRYYHAIRIAGHIKNGENQKD